VPLANRSNAEPPLSGAMCSPYRSAMGAQSAEMFPGVERFEQLRQVSPKNEFRFGFSMEFADLAAYDAYNVHPDHVAFVRDRWVREVEAFVEIDYVPLG
jgi:hypothetical protein